MGGSAPPEEKIPQLRGRANYHKQSGAVTTGERRSWTFAERAIYSRKRKLLHFPSVARAKKFGQVAGTALGDDVLDLLVHHIFVAREIIPRAKNADRRGEARAVFDLHDVLAAGIALGQGEPRPIVEDVAVLENLDERGTLVHGRVLQGFFQVALEDVDRAGDESGFRTDCQGHGIEGAVQRPERR